MPTRVNQFTGQIERLPYPVGRGDIADPTNPFSMAFTPQSFDSRPGPFARALSSTGLGFTAQAGGDPAHTFLPDGQSPSNIGAQDRTLGGPGGPSPEGAVETPQAPSNAGAGAGAIPGADIFRINQAPDAALADAYAALGGNASALDPIFGIFQQSARYLPDLAVLMGENPMAGGFTDFVGNFLSGGSNYGSIGDIFTQFMNGGDNPVIQTLLEGGNPNEIVGSLADIVRAFSPFMNPLWSRTMQAALADLALQSNRAVDETGAGAQAFSDAFTNFMQRWF